jgi:HEPN domain-containing protein
MTNDALARDYLVRCQKKLKALEVLLSEEAYPDVVREAQEVVELTVKAMLRFAGVEPPKWHDVGGTLLEFRDRFPDAVSGSLDAVATASARLRREREASFYGDVDMIPSEVYSREDAVRAVADARMVVEAAGKVIPLGPSA